MDPKTAGIVGRQRNISEGKGLLGSRSINVPKAGRGRSASPAGSVASSVVSAAADSPQSPITSRSSSPPTSPGGRIPPSFLAATLPDDGGPGAATPSSTRAEAGEEVPQLSIPVTPVEGHHVDVPPASNASPLYDLVPSNLRLAAAEQMLRGLSAQSATGSFSSSLAMHPDTSSRQSDEQRSMMKDVSEISTPTSTPRAVGRDLEGSARGEGSLDGEGDMDDLRSRLEGLGRDARESDLAPGAQHDEDPNAASDLEALKSGELKTHKSAHKQNSLIQDPMDDMAGAGVVQVQEEQVLPNSHVKQSVSLGQGVLATNVEQSGGLVGQDPAEGNLQEMEQGTVGQMGGMSKSSEAMVDDEKPGDKSRGAAEEDEPKTTPANGRSSKEAVFAGGVDEPSTKIMSSVLDETTILPEPTVAERQGNDDAAPKPIQMHIEPAPIAQPAEADIASDRAPEPVSADQAESSTTDAVSPTFPTAPNDEPDTLQPLGPPDPSPVDPTFIKSFPEVPDEERPRVEVHVSSSPVNTPQKGLLSSTRTPGTPLADLPGHSKSLPGPFTTEQQTPSGTGRERVQLEVDTTPNPVPGLSKRLSTRKSPKSPLLDDEDPGDFEPGEGWAVVTK